MQRTIYAYDISINPQRGKNTKVLENYEKDFMIVLQRLCRRKKQNKIIKYEKDRKILYLDSISHNESSHTIKMKFISAKYGVVRNVMNTITCIERGRLKQKPDGDLEKNHLIIKFEENNQAVMLYEYNKDGIGFPKLIDYINEKIKEIHEKKKDFIYYHLTYKSIVSRDFLKSLEKLKRVKAVTLTIDQNEIGVSETKSFAGRNDISEDIDIVLKPAARGLAIRGNTVKEFYKMYNDKSIPIKRITVKGDRDTKDPLTFDTEKMKEKYPIDVIEESTGEVNTEDLFNEMGKLCQYF